MKFKVEDVTFRGAAALAEHVQRWVEAQDSAVSVRRVFYAMVKDQRVENTYAQYRSISAILTKLRRGGMLDWARISDSTRGDYKTPSFESADDCVNSALEDFRLDRWEDQDEHVEVWTEKRGLVSVLLPTTDDLDVTIVEMGGKRVITEDTVASLLAAQDSGKVNTIIYVGDYDPSGLRMDKNNKEQLGQWGVKGTWVRVALTTAEISQFKIPIAFTVPDTATRDWLAKHPGVEIIGHDKEGRSLVNKLEKDGNAAWFRSNHKGKLFQVEVDALDAPILREIVRKAIEQRLDQEKYDAKLEIENEQRKEIEERLKGGTA